MPDGRIAIWDSQNARIAFFSASGDFLDAWSHASGFNTSNGLVVDAAGTLYVTRPVGEPGEYDTFWKLGLVRLGEGGKWVDSIVPPVIPVKRLQWQAQSADGGGRSSTSVRYAPGGFWRWHPGGYFVAADGGRYTITLGRTASKPVRIERSMAPVPVSAAEQENEKAMITWNLRQTNPAWVWSGDAMPAQKAPLQAIVVTRDGRIWARVAMPSEQIPERELEPPRSDGRPQRLFRDATVYEVFSPEGEFLGRVDFPPRTTLQEADGDVVWAITRDEDGLPGVMRYRVVPGLE